MESLFSSIERWAEERGDAVAWRDTDAGGIRRQVTWRQTVDAVRALAHHLRSDSPQRPVLVSMANRGEVWIAILAALWADRWVLPVPGESQPLKLRTLIDRLAVQTIIGEGHAVAEVGAAVEQVIAADAILALPGGGREVPGRGRGALLLESSGTTGRPKILRRDMDALLADGHNCRVATALTTEDVMLAAVPLSHSYGIDHAVLAAALAGCTVDIMRRFDPHVARARLLLPTEAITVLPAVPLMLDVLVKATAPAKPTALRQVFSAGSPLPRRVADAFAAHFGLAVGQIYGASEFGSVTFNDPSHPPFDALSVGRPMTGVEIRIVDAETPDLKAPLPAHRSGNVAVRAPSMMSDCLNDPLRPDAQGFLLSGDLGHLDGEGRLYLSGRLKLLIDVAGLKVNPLEVEAVLSEHPKVREAVVIPVVYSDVVSRLKAIIVPEENAEPERGELQAFAAARLVPHKVPRFFEIRRDVPRSPTGKILRQELLRENAL